MSQNPASLAKEMTELLDMEVMDSLILERQGNQPREDHVPVALYRSADGRIQVWLVYKRTDMSPDRSPYFGIVDVGKGQPDFGSVDPVNLVKQGHLNPDLKMTRDKSYQWSADGKLMSEVMRDIVAAYRGQ